MEAKKINELYNDLIKSSYYFFPKEGKLKLSDKPGVYVIFSPHSKVLHVGSTPRGKKGINQRIYDHMSSSSSFYHKFLKKRNPLSE